MSLVLLMFLSLVAGQAPATLKYQSSGSQCSGYSFEYPRDWQIVKNSDDITAECAVTLRPVDYARRMAQYDVDVYTVTVQVEEHTFLQVASENGFDFDGKWIVVGRQGLSSDAQVSKANGWLILRGTGSAGCFHKNAGGYAGLCDEYRVVARHQDDDRIVALSGGAQTQAALDVVLKTFKFMR